MIEFMMIYYVFMKAMMSLIKKKFKLFRRFRIVHPERARVTLCCNFVSRNVRSLPNEVFARGTNHGCG